MFDASKNKSILTNSMGNGIKPSRPGSVVTWEAHFQNQISLFCYSFSPSSKRTLKKLPTRPQHMRKNNHCWVQMGGKCTTEEGTIIERKRVVGRKGQR